MQEGAQYLQVGKVSYLIRVSTPLLRYMVMNVKMDGRTWEQLLFILLQITQLTLTESPPRF